MLDPSATLSKVRRVGALACILLPLCLPAYGQTVFDINTLVDDASFSGFGDGDCAIREALANITAHADITSGDCPVPGGGLDTLRFSVSGTIMLDGVDLQSAEGVVFDGPGFDQLEINGGDSTLVLSVVDFTVLRRLTIANGKSQYGAVRVNENIFVDRVLFKDNTSTSDGGGLYIEDPLASVTVSNSTFTGNEAGGSGGGMYVGGGASVEMTNTTFSGNYAAKGGGAISIATSTLEAENLTIFNNLSDSLAGGIHTRAELDMKHSIVLGNIALDGVSDPDCTFGGVATYTNRGYNLVGDGTGCTTVGSDLTSVYPSDELDTQLKVSGGGTPTHALIALSQAIDAGETVDGGTASGGCVQTGGGTLIIDQRFLPRARGVGMGGTGCDIGAFEAQTAIDYVELGAEIFLEGAYTGGFNMGVGATFQSSRPTFQPYRATLFNGTSLEYDGLEQFGFEGDQIDWLLVSLRSSTDAASEVARTVAILQDDGTVTGIDGGYTRFSGLTPGSYYVVVDHWNHIPVMSADPVDFTSGPAGAVFKSSLATAYSMGGDAMKNLGGGAFGMFACDVNSDGFVTAPDFNIWNSQTTAGANGYQRGDCNMDGDVTAPDFNIWNVNTTSGAASQVPG